jgi:hypothetical protein
MDYYRLHRTGKKYPRAFFAAQWDAYELLRTREAELDRDEEREEDTDAPWCRIDEVRAVTFPTDLKSGILNGLRTLLCAEGLPREVRESLLRNTRVSIIRQEWTLGQLSNLYVVTRMWSPFALPCGVEIALQFRSQPSQHDKLFYVSARPLTDPATEWT